MGINTTRYKVLAFVISSHSPGIAGALFDARQFLHTNDFQFIRSIEIIIMIVLGGEWDRSQGGAGRDCDHDSARVAAATAR